MHDPNSFIAAARALQRANRLSEETALDYTARIGDTPELADDGRVIVRGDDGAELARVFLPGVSPDPREVKLTITLPSGVKAWTERGKWYSTDAGFANYCTVFCTLESASCLPHPHLEAAKKIAGKLGGTLSVDGQPPGDGAGDIH